MIVTDTDVSPEQWSDGVRGRVGFRTLFGGGTRTTDSLTAGIGEMAPGDRLERHRHDPAEVYYVLQGQGTLLVEGEEHALCEGSAVFIPGNSEHALHNTGQETLRVFYTLAAGDFDQVDYRFSDG